MEQLLPIENTQIMMRLPWEVTQIVVEFHERFFANGKTKSKEFIKSMNAHGYKIFAISDSYEEVSFVKVSALNV